jgi:hypothetical protein
MLVTVDDVEALLRLAVADGELPLMPPEVAEFAS